MARLRWFDRRFDFSFSSELHPELFSRSALHPRLGMPMRLVDLMLFVAEHDDHHLASITELARGRGAR
jgi:uncharacterized damage-inducible protein DinB